MVNLDLLIRDGFLDIIILKLLKDKKASVDELEDIIKKHIKLKESTFYSAIQKLENNKLIKSHWAEALQENEIPKKYYLITDKGIEELNQQINQWKDLISGAAIILDINT